jgi:hypothetical protein
MAVLFFMPVRDGKQVPFKRALFEEIMGRGAIDLEYPLRWIRYEDGDSKIYGADEDEIDHLIFEYFEGTTFFDHLWELIDRTGAFISWAGARGGAGTGVTSPDVLLHLPLEFANNPKAALILKDGRDIEIAVYGDAS